MSAENDIPTTLTMKGYLPRVADRGISGALQRRGAVLIEGCHGCGKTWAARHFARSEARLDSEALMLLAATDPAAVLDGPTPRLLDEWQNAPHLWNRVRRECHARKSRSRRRDGYKAHICAEPDTGLITSTELTAAPTASRWRQSRPWAPDPHAFRAASARVPLRRQRSA